MSRQAALYRYRVKFVQMVADDLKALEEFIFKQSDNACKRAS